MLITSMVIKLIVLKQCCIIWNKISLVSAKLFVIKWESCRFILRVGKESDILRDFGSNQGIKHMIRVVLSCYVNQR